MIRKFFKSIVPPFIWNRLGILRRRWVTRDDSSRSAKEVFSRIYEKRIWTSENELSSGSGSRCAAVVNPYIDVIRRWADTHNAKEMRALDLGCGDFHVGSQIFPFFDSYIGADIVPILIESHRRNHIAPNLEFCCVDGIDDELPQADVVFIRQVLQHLSNEQIQKILSKLTQFKHAIVTEHVPHPSQLKMRNLDKIHGGGIRLERGSGVFLQDPPFNFQALESTVLLELPHGTNGEREGVVVTTHYRLQ
jgi:hypothetical protein